VVTLSDLEKEYTLIHACLQLAQKSSQRWSRGTVLSLAVSVSRRADEVVGLLVDAGMFDVAVNVCQLFDIKMNVVFEHLAVRCVNITRLQLLITISCTFSDMTWHGMT